MAVVFLLTRQWCQVVSLTAGVVGMCKEHLGVALALKVPVFFLVCRFHPAVLLSAPQRQACCCHCPCMFYR